MAILAAICVAPALADVDDDETDYRQSWETCSRYAVEVDQPLFDAIAAKSERKIRLAVAQGADVNSCVGGGSALHDAVTRRFSTIAKLLIDLGADVNALDASGDSAISFAAATNDVLTMNVLLDSGANPEIGRTGGALGRAASLGNERAVVRLLKAGAKLNGTDSQTWTPLISAANRRHVEIVRLLLEAGADPNLMWGEYELTALHAAFGIRVAPMPKEEEGLALAIVRLLIGHGANINAVFAGETALQSAVSMRASSIVAELQAAGAIE